MRLNDGKSVRRSYKYPGSVLEQNEVAVDLDFKVVMEAFKTKTENAMRQTFGVHM